jgi:MraZ protein
VFLGKYSSTIDQQTRFLAPANYGKQLTSGLYMIQGFDRNLVVLPSSAFEEVYRKVSSQNIADPLARMLLRLTLSSAHEIEFDEKAYITIPSDLRDFAQIHDQVLVVGQGDYFELWQPDLWEEQEIQLRDIGANASRFSTLTVTTR